MSTRHSSRILLKSVLSLVSLTLCLFGLELGARIFLPPQQTVTVSGLSPAVRSAGLQRSINHDSDIGDLLIWGENGTRLRPLVTARIRNQWLSSREVSITTNSIGLRYDELEAKADDEFRILVLGDSITFCDYVEEELGYTRLMEKLASGRSRRIRFINAGMPGAATIHELALYMEIREHIRADLVLLAMYLNDAQGEPAFTIRTVPPALARSRFLTWATRNVGVLEARLTQEHHPADWLDPEWREDFRAGRDLEPGDMFHLPNAFDYEIFNAHWDFGLAWNPASWPELSRTVSLLARAASSDGARTAVTLFPVHFQVKGTVEDCFPQESCRQMCSELELPFLDLRPALRRRWLEEQPKLFYDHCHLTPEGNRHVAQILVAWLEREGLIPAS